MKFHATLKRHQHIAKVDGDGHDESSIVIQIECGYVPEVAHGLVDLMMAGPLIVELKPLQREMAMKSKGVE